MMYLIIPSNPNHINGAKFKFSDLYNISINANKAL